MRHITISIAALLLLISMASEAQTDVSIRKSQYKDGKAGFKEAWDQVGEGDSYYTARGIWYGSAYDAYLKALAYNGKNAELNYKLGVAALLSDHKGEASQYLLKAFELNNNVSEDILLMAGRSLAFAGKYDMALENLNNYLVSPVKKPAASITLANKLIEECKSAIIITRDTLRVEILNTGKTINSAQDDYSEIISADGKTIYFASRRETPRGSNYYSDSKFDENIFVSLLTNGSWGEAISAGKNLTTKYCETPLFLNSTGDLIYIYAGYTGGGDVMVSELKKGEWKTPENISFDINSSGSETSFAIAPSGNEIYFVTDKGKGSLGGKDIYYIKKLSEKKWSKMQNAGPLINTVYDEEAISFSEKGDTMWFSSKGHNSIGGFDIFYSVKNSFGAWDSVRNCGYPINTPWDEIFYKPSPTDDSTFYFVSNRSGGFGGLDILTGRFLPPEPVVVVAPPPPPPVVKPDTIVIRDTVVVIKQIVAPPPPKPVVIVPVPVKEDIVYLSGKITDSETADAIIAKVDIIDPSSNIVVATTASSDVDGSYRVRLPSRKTFIVDMRATGFLSELKSITIPDTSTKVLYTLNGKLNKIKVGKKVVLNNILFESGKAKLTGGSYAEINRLFGVMNDNPAMKVEISGHTDKTGSEPINFKLSEARAKAVVDYLVAKGISQSRLEYKGFGSLQGIADNATPAGRAKNRRVEFKILEF